MLVEGTQLSTGLGRVVVQSYIGEGGQGWVYRGVDDQGQAWAVKWYKVTSVPPGHREAIEYLIERGAPSDRFLWPMSLVEAPDAPSFGYLMPLRPDGYEDLVALLHGTDATGQVVDPSFEATITMCRELARTFLRLHGLGLCYRDISSGNIFFRPDTGAILVCDNDNVGVDGTPGAVFGTQGFMAPEVVRLHDPTTALPSAYPSALTDLHSLAVGLFHILLLAHPLVGAKADRGLRESGWYLRHYGNEPLFVFDPTDDSNRPVDDIPSRYWNAYPQFIRDLFVTAFTDGLSDPESRVRESVWAKAMLRLRDALWPCPVCGAMIFFDSADPDRACAHPSCAQRPAFRPRQLELGDRRLVLAPGSRLMFDHLGGDEYATQPAGRVQEHPSDIGRWGLENLTEAMWTVTTPSGSVHDVPPGSKVETTLGSRIHFGRVDGVVTA